MKTNEEILALVAEATILNTEVTLHSAMVRTMVIEDYRDNLNRLETIRKELNIAMVKL